MSQMYKNEKINKFGTTFMHKLKITQTHQINVWQRCYVFYYLTFYVELILRSKTEQAIF
jgi:hypothetical protein